MVSGKLGFQEDPGLRIGSEASLSLRLKRGEAIGVVFLGSCILPSDPHAIDRNSSCMPTL